MHLTTVPAVAGVIDVAQHVPLCLPPSVRCYPKQVFVVKTAGGVFDVAATP